MNDWTHQLEQWHDFNLLIGGAAATGAFFVLVGVSGLIYIVSTGVHGQWRELQLGIDDWIWYVGLPLMGYGAILASAVATWEVSSSGS